MPANTITLAGLTVVQPPDAGFVNWFYSSTGAGRYGHGLFLLRTADYAAAVDAAGAGTTSLVLGDHRRTKQLTIPVHVASGMPYAGPDGRTVPGVLAVQVFDARYAKDTAVNAAFNVQKAGFTYTGADPDFIAATTNAGTPWTWPLMVDNVELPALPAAPAWKPRNVVFDGWQLHRVVDWLAANLFLVVGWDRAAGKFTFDEPGKMNAANKALFDAAAKSNLLRSGGAGARNPKRLPDKFSVVFQGHNADDPAAPFAQRAYRKQVTVGAQVTRTQPLHAGGYVAAYVGGAWKEAAALDAVAADLAARAYAFVSVAPAVHEFSGIVPFDPDGAIREVLWTADHRGARTRIGQGVRFDWAPSANGGLWGYADPGMPGAMPRLELPSDQLVVGLDGLNSSIDQAGTRRVWGGGGGSPIKLGTLAADWTPGDTTVSVTPAGGTSPDDDVDVEICLGGPVVAFGNVEGDTVGYTTAGGRTFLVNHAPLPTGAQYEYLGHTGACAIFMPLKAY